MFKKEHKGWSIYPADEEWRWKQCMQKMKWKNKKEETLYEELCMKLYLNEFQPGTPLHTYFYRHLLMTQDTSGNIIIKSILVIVEKKRTRGFLKIT